MIHDLGLDLLRRGHDVTILAPSDRVAGNVTLSEVEGMRVVFVRAGTTKGIPRMVRALREARLSSVVWRRGKKFFREHKFDLIAFYSPSIFWGGLVARLKALYRCPSYLIQRDMFPQWALDLEILREGLVHRFFRRKELQQYAAADVIAVQSHANLQYFNRYRSARFPLKVLYNWARPETIVPQVPGFRRRFDLDGKLIYVYGGNIGVAQDIPNLLRLAESLSGRPDIFFLLVGEGSEVEKSQRWIEARRLTNIRIVPALGQEQYLALLAECTVGLISLDRRLTTHNFPGKILGYMQASLPVLCSLNPGNDLAGILHEANAGFCSVNGDDSLLRKHALALADDQTLRKRMGENARQLLLAKFTAERAGEQLLQHLRLLLDTAGKQEHTAELRPAA